MYEYFLKLRNIYSHLEDALSKKVFLSRLRYDLERSPENLNEMELCYNDLAVKEKNERVDRYLEYFYYPERFKSGTAFVDCGAFDGRDSLYFADWCGGRYSKIYAFEPNSQSFEVVKDNLRNSRAEVFHAALSDCSGEDQLIVESQWKSYMIRSAHEKYGRTNPINVQKTETITLLKLDEIVKCAVGFIKIQAMGKELAVLRGGAVIIKKNTPILSLVIHGFPGEMLVVMEYINNLNRDYQFLLRQYHDFEKKSAGRMILFASLRG